jgi:hypothetical protein
MATPIPDVECEQQHPALAVGDALLLDLAEYKHMSLSSCLEEILLHTNETLGDGVASPHTRTQRRHIQQLKRKHGIDYDSHASYRFVEKR